MSSGQFRWHMFRNNHHLYCKPTAACQTLQVIYYREIVRARTPSWYIYNSGQVMDFKSHGFSKTFEKLRIWWKGKRSTSVRPPTPPPHPFSIYYQYFVNLQHDHHLHTNWNLAARWLFLFSVTDTIFAKWKNASNKISLDFDTVNMFFKNVWHNVETLLI